MKQLFIGIGIVLLWSFASPLTVMWLIGKIYEGKSPAWSVTKDKPPASSGLAIVLFVSSAIFSILYAIALAIALYS